MNILVVLVGLVLVLCEGRIVSYRRPVHNSETRDESSLEDFHDGSTEEYFEEPIREKQVRSKPHEKSYGYSDKYNKKSHSESDYRSKNPQYSSGRSRGKYSSYGKQPYKSYAKESPSKQNAYNSMVGERKKDQRSIPRYQPIYHPYSAPVYKPVIHHRPLPPPPPPPPSYKPAPAVQKHNCQQKLLIGCSPTVTRVPCGDSYHSPLPTLGSMGPSYPESSHHAPQFYHSNGAAGYNPQPPPAAYQPYHAPPPVRPHNQQSKPNVPTFAHPVKEETQDAGKQPFISAFPTTTAKTTTMTTTTAQPQLPTVPADRDQNFRSVGSTVSTPTEAAGEDVPSHKEASGDEPEHTPPAPAESDDEEP